MSSYQDAVKAKEWLNANTIYEVDDVRPDGLGLPPGISLDRYWFVVCQGMSDYWTDAQLIAFAREKGWEGELV